MTELEAMVRVKELVHKHHPKKRTCLGCGEFFISDSSAHRICASCKQKNSHYGVSALKTCEIRLDKIKANKDNE